MWDNSSALKGITRCLFILVFLLLLAAAAVWVYRSPEFPIKKVKIEGDLKRVSNSELQVVAQKYIRGNIFSADLNGAQEAFQNLPWIEHASVRRRLPDSVEINLVERKPVARWKESALVDSNGNLFQVATDESFPIFEGENGTVKNMVNHYQNFAQLLQPLNLKIAKLEYSPRSAWTIELENGISVRLGREQEIERLQRFARVWPTILLAQQNSLKYVDMRYKDGFAVCTRKNDNDLSTQTDKEASFKADTVSGGNE